ncbi:MAG: hypothetical protein DRJ50_12430 [Actinobacteria bacterium]|nr:MAG: hypothetical protein DRJ50_12430 [Actinomycetota bacterium]
MNDKVTPLFDPDLGDTFQMTCSKCGYEVWFVCVDDPEDPTEIKIYCGNEEVIWEAMDDDDDVA